MMVGRFITGMAGAGRTLSYTYVSSVVPQGKRMILYIIHMSFLQLILHDICLAMLKQTKTWSLLGPVANLLVAEINTSISIGSLVIPVNPYNSVGLIVAVGEVILWLTMLLFLREPPAKEKSTLKGSNAEQTLSLGSSCKCKYCVWYTLRCKLPIHVSHPWSIVRPYSLQSYGGLGSCDFSYIWMGASSNLISIHVSVIMLWEASCLVIRI